MASKMDVDGDPPLPLLEGTSGLKRCSSAPMINMLMDSSPSTGTPTNRQSQDDMTKHITVSPSLLIPVTGSGFRPVDNRMRTRHYSTSSLAQPSTPSTGSAPIRIPTRIHQLKREDVVNKNVHRELAHEREIQSAMQMSQSWDELTLDESVSLDQNKRPRSLSESLHIFTSGFPAMASSPSPTRVGKQCFSPSMQAPVALNGNCLNFTPSPSPSPTRRCHPVRRSLSPIVSLRPSSLSATQTVSRKRTFENDSETGFSQPKRIFNGMIPVSLSIANPMRTSIQSQLTGSFDDAASEHSTAPLNPPLTFSFTPVTDNCSTTTTDSENDMCDTASSTSQELNNNPG